MTSMLRPVADFGNYAYSFVRAKTDIEILDSIKSRADYGKNRDRLLSMDPQLVSTKTGNTPLCAAIRNGGSREDIQTLLDKGSDLKFVKKNGWFPLHQASRYNPSVIEILIKAGADVNAKQSAGWTPLHLVARKHPKYMGELIKAGADVNAKKNDGWGPLHLVARNHPKYMGELIKAGADVNAKDEEGRTPLHLAVGYCPSYMDDLIKAGADVNAKDDRGSTPLHLAALRKSSKERIQLLIDHGADPKALNDEGKTYLDVAKDAAKIKEIANQDLPEIQEGFFFERDENGAFIQEGDDERAFELVHERSTDDLYRLEGQSSLAAKSLIVFGATPFFVVGAALEHVIRIVSDIASLLYNLPALFKSEGATAMLKSLGTGIPKAIASRIWEAVKTPVHGLKTMGYSLYGLYDGQAARSGINKAWGEGYLLKLSRMMPEGNRQDQVDGKMKFYLSSWK